MTESELKEIVETMAKIYKGEFVVASFETEKGVARVAFGGRGAVVQNVSEGIETMRQVAEKEGMRVTVSLVANIVEKNVN